MEPSSEGPDHELGIDCWCGPQIIVVKEGEVYLHYHNNEVPPAAMVIGALAQILVESKEGT